MVQDESSALAGLCADFKPQMKVLDICGAPGGKSMNAAMMMDDQGSIICRDVSWKKLERIEENTSRLGISCIMVQQWDGTVPDPEMVEQADVVIADVPCSGLGVIGKKTDIKYRMTPESMISLVKLQRDILEHAWRYVRPGGVLLYSTCTVNPEENEAQVEYMTQNYPLYTESLDSFLPETLQCESTKHGWLQLMPGVHACDGFFMARLRKKEVL